MIPVRDAFALAFKHESAGRPDAALAIYKQILAAIPEHPGALLKIALNELVHGRPDAARALMVRAIDSASAQQLPAADIWVALGRLDLEQGDHDAARHAFEEAAAAGCAEP